GDIEKMKKLLAKGEDINARDKRDRATLHVAIWAKQPEAIRFLIDNGVDVNSRDKDKGSLTDQAALHLLPRMVENAAALAQALLDKGAEVDARDSWGWTPLMWAGNSGDLATAKVLVAGGADVNARDTKAHNEGHTALMHTYHLDFIEL